MSVRKKAILKTTAAILLTATAACAKLYGTLPFGGGVYIGCLAAGVPVWALAPFYLAAGIAADYSLPHVIAVAVSALAGTLASIPVFRRPRWLIPIYAVSCLGSIYGIVVGENALRAALAALIGGIGAAAAFAVFCENETARAAGIAGVTVILAIGLHRIPIAASGVFGLFAMTFLRASDERTLPLSVLYALGCVLASHDFASAFGYVAVVAVGCFVAADRWIAGTAIAATTAAYTLLTGANVWCALALVVGAFFGLFVPVRRKISERAVGPSIRPVLRKMAVAAEACRSAQIVLGTPDPETDGMAVVLGTRLCEGCKNYAVCRVDGSEFEEAARRTLEKRRVGIDLLPDGIVERCVKAAEVPKLLAAMLKDHECNLACNELRKAAAGLAADELRAFADLVGGWVKEAETECYADGEAFARAKAALKERKGVLRSLIVTDGGKGVLAVAEARRDEDVADAINASGKRRYALDTVTQLERGAEYRLMPKPHFSVVFGAAQTQKKEACGDAYFVRKLNAGTVLAVLCDGMGSGKSARDLSDRTIGLIESCFAAGFDTAHVLRVVNSLLSLAGERFSCVDLCLIDLESGEANFVKLGGVESYVLKEDATLKIEGGALPLGIAEPVSPVTESVRLESGDLIVLTTDGVTDTGMPYLDRSANPQTAADRIVEAALGADGGNPHDDMTALVLRAV